MVRVRWIALGLSGLFTIPSLARGQCNDFYRFPNRNRDVSFIEHVTEGISPERLQSLEEPRFPEGTGGEHYEGVAEITRWGRWRMPGRQNAVLTPEPSALTSLGRDSLSFIIELPNSMEWGVALGHFEIFRTNRVTGLPLVPTLRTSVELKGLNVGGVKLGIGEFLQYASSGVTGAIALVEGGGTISVFWSPNHGKNTVEGTSGRFHWRGWTPADGEIYVIIRGAAMDRIVREFEIELQPEGEWLPDRGEPPAPLPAPRPPRLSRDEEMRRAVEGRLGRPLNRPSEH